MAKKINFYYYNYNNWAQAQAVTHSLCDVCAQVLLFPLGHRPKRE